MRIISHDHFTESFRIWLPGSIGSPWWRFDQGKESGIPVEPRRIPGRVTRGDGHWSSGWIRRFRRKRLSAIRSACHGKNSFAEVFKI